MKTYDNTSRKLLAFKEMLKFIEEFKEEGYGLILSETKELDLDGLKKELSQSFVDKYLKGLTKPPRAFPTELFRFFYNSI